MWTATQKPEITGKVSEKFLKNANNNNLLKTKRILKPRYLAKWGPFLHLACQGGRIPTFSRSVEPLDPGLFYLKTQRSIRCDVCLETADR